MKRRSLLKMFGVAPAIILTPNLLMPVRAMAASLIGIDPGMNFIGVDPVGAQDDLSSIWLISWGSDEVSQITRGQLNRAVGRYS